MPKTITFGSRVEVRITCDADGMPVSGEIHYQASNGHPEIATVGGAERDVVFASIGSVAQRNTFRGVLAAMVTAGRVAIGDV